MTDGFCGNECDRAPAADFPYRSRELTDLVSTESLQSLQDRFAAIAEVSASIVTTKGVPITEPSWGSDYSKMVATSPKAQSYFLENLRVLAEDPDRRVASVCHPNNSLYAAAINHAGARIGMLVVGAKPTAKTTEDETRAVAQKYDLDSDELVRLASSLRPWGERNKKATYRLADLLADMVSKLYAQALKIEDQYRDLRVVHELSELLSATHDNQEILDHTVCRAVGALGVKACAIRLFDEETSSLTVRAVCSLSSEYLKREPSKLGENPIDTAAFKGETVYIEDARTDPRSPYKDNARREGIVSGLCVPMSFSGQTVGVLRIYSSKPTHFDEADASLLRSLGSQAASAIIHGRLFDAQIEAGRFRDQMHHSGEIQRRMIPPAPPNHSYLTFGCVYRPTLDVGGDFYDFIEFKFGDLGLCIADVVGKGMPAALMMASIRSALRAHATSIFDLDQITSHVNRHLCRDTLISEFATLFYGVFSADEPRFTYCNAGHPPPLLIRDGKIIELNTGGMVIGVDPDQVYERGIAQLRPNDSLVLFTDGVTEALDFHGVEYGPHRLRESALKHQGLEAQQFADQLLWDVRRFVGLADQSDDITIVTVKVSESARRKPR